MLGNTHISWSTNLARLIFVVLILIVAIGPLISLVIDTASWAWRSSATDFDNIASWSRQFYLLLKSAGFAIAVTIADVLIAVFAASRFWTWNTRVSWTVAALLFSMIAIPPYIHILAWRFAIDWLNAQLGTVGLPELVFSGWGAAWWVQTMALAPVSTGLALLGLYSVDSRLFDVGRLVRPDIDAFRLIVLPLAAPPLLAASGFVFLFTIVDYSVPSAFLLNTYALEIFAEFSANHSTARAFLTSSPLLVLTLIVLALTLKFLRQVPVRPHLRKRSRQCTPFWPRWFARLQGLAVAILVIQIVVPIFSLGVLTNNWTAIEDAILSASDEIMATARTAALASVIGIPIAFFAASRMGRVRTYWWFLVLLPIGLPAPLVGIGIISLWNNDWTYAVYDSELILVLTYLARFLAVATLVMYAQLRRTDSLLLDAARIVRPSGTAYWTQIYIPLMMRSGLVAMILTFVLALGELPASLLTLPPGSSTITIRVYNYMHYGASEMVASLCLLIPLLTIAYSTILFLLAYGWRQLLPKLPRRVE